MTDNRQLGIQCSQFEALLPDALDGVLTPESKQAFEAHAGSCTACGPMFAEAREGMVWLRSLEEVEPPRNLVHNILAATSLAESPAAKVQAAPKTGWGVRLWKAVRPVLTGATQPRFVTSFAMAFFSLSLTLNLAGVKLSDLAHIDWHPASLSKAVVLQYTKVENKVVNYYENMRLVYEIESRVRELRKAADAPQTPGQQQEQPKEDKKKNDKNDTSGRPEERHDNYSQELDHTVIAYMKTSGKGA